MGSESSFHNALASSFISLLTGKIIELTCTEIGYVWNVDENLRSLGTSSQIVQDKLKRLGHDKLPVEWIPWVREVTSLFYDVDDKIDGIMLGIMKQNHINQNPQRQINSQHQAHVQDQVCTSRVFTLFRSRSGRRARQSDDHLPVPIVPQNENQVRSYIVSSLKKWGLPHKINNLLERLQLIDKQVDGLLQGVGSSRLNGGMSAAHSSPMGRVSVSIPSSSGHLHQVVLAREREEDKRIIIEYLLHPSLRGRGGICIVGMSGLGKSTLAQHITNDSRIRKYYGSPVWVPMPGDFNSVANNHIFAPSLQGRVANGYPVHRGRRILVVLDDLWNVHHTAWSRCISTLGPETTFLITTRDPKVASITATTPHHIKRLSDKDCMDLIIKMLPENLSHQYDRSISQIAKKCAGLPLVANLYGLMIPARYREKGPEAAFAHLEESDLWELSEFEAEIFPALRFDDPSMPPDLGKFIAYLYLFPDGYYFEKDELSQLWMAEGYVTPEKWNASCLKNSVKYFDELLSRSILYLSHYPKEDEMATYQIHEFTHKFAQKLASSMCYQMKDSDTPFLPVKHIRHLSLSSQKLDLYHTHIEKFYSHLRTFLLLSGKRANITDVLQYFFHNLKYLRVVSLNRSHITTLPRSISNLKHLRYLDASNTLIKSLPDPICEILGLRVIKLQNCKLLSLPSKIANLVNLFHLDMNMAHLHTPPICIGSLTNLQALNVFPVHDAEGYRITELKNMNALRESIKIMKLENVTSALQAENARLCQKSHLNRLELHWTPGSYIPETLISTILDKLKPHDHLTELRLANYSGDVFPSWLGSPSCYLKSIHLFNCPYIKKLPSFWKLPQLITLTIDTASSLVELDRQFFGDHRSTRFPKLKSLELQNMESLARWDELRPNDMPRLCVLKLINCPTLSGVSTLRFFNMLEHLEIIRCPRLEDPELPLSVSLYYFE
uniref:NB-ARC domain-containing protein n=1 Tax=Chenopodium quinoa TaxID=63459 RepID=A0A803LZW0_CHEQI